MGEAATPQRLARKRRLPGGVRACKYRAFNKVQGWFGEGMSSKMGRFAQTLLLGSKGKRPGGRDSAWEYRVRCFLSTCAIHFWLRKSPPHPPPPTPGVYFKSETGKSFVCREKKPLPEIELNPESLYIYIYVYIYICALCSPLVPFPLEPDNNSVPGTSCQF